MLPAAGTSVVINSAIDLVVSDGPQMAKPVLDPDYAVSKPLLVGALRIILRGPLLIGRE